MKNAFLIGMLGVTCLIAPAAAEDLKGVREKFCNKVVQCQLETRWYKNLSAEGRDLLTAEKFDRCYQDSGEFTATVIPLGQSLNTLVCLGSTANMSCSEIHKNQDFDTLSPECQAIQKAWEMHKKAAK
ncbi:hypothetical protein [Sneathiella chinensis]|uniref:Secreted protein n=1 Tax=Sneathiella chinensis TaxID=349750 RepID=A0ABQ5TYJ7_9PROT|nr:hypothetical protein [Sneathiella chinensis]GLQ04882.1 hypothetical protein GCM10007924_01030 [Sneathiella chinensis]